VNRRGARAVILVGVAYAIIVTAWLMSSRPFAGPDESAHYLRALGIANGQLVGARVPYPYAIRRSALWGGPGATATAEA
jgi:hypothetical protein